MIRNALLGGLLALPLLSLAACQRAGEPPPTEPARPVLSMLVQAQSGPQMRLAGTIASQVQADLAFRLAGRLASRSVNVGDRVTAGQIVAELDPAGLELARRAANADLASAKAQLENAQGIEQRQRELFASGTITQTSLELAELRLKLAQATLTRAQSSLRKAEDQLGYAQLRAEFDGVVTAIHMDPGSDLMPGQPVLTVAKPDLRDAVVDVPEGLAATLAQDAAFEVLLQLEPAITAQGTLREIAPEADPATRTRRIKIGLVDPVAAFRIGTTVTVQSATGSAAQIEIPLSAIREIDGRSYVWLIDGDKHTVSRLEVVIGRRSGDTAIVDGGLEAGMRIAVAGANSLVDGQVIRATREDQ
ncbi:efflux RND transporter periplasmic adaptor subunit [Devosia sp.]|uniref:efflux RND transporter periplasmic adaptor subunit n=1 Tax=Devosia sp. TaxID=1871048 RepID=UPI002EFE3C1E